MGFDNLKKFFISYQLCFFLLVYSTIFFLVQHYLHLSWDFSAYVINAKYFFHQGDYFEVYRAPLSSLLLGIFLFLGKFGEYLYVVFVNLFFFYANLKLSRVLFDKYSKRIVVSQEFFSFLFYYFSLSGFVLAFGLVEGTEMLSLAFFELFLAFFILRKSSGLFLGLAVLSRYNFLLFFVFLFFDKKVSRIFKNLVLFLIPILPWLIYNRFRFGNFFSSIVDSYYLNVLSRLSLVQQFSPTRLLLLLTWFLPFFLLGLFLALRFLFSEKKTVSKSFSRRAVVLLFFLSLLFFLIDVYSIPYKVTRYMFNLSLPVAFLSCFGFIFLFHLFPRLFQYRRIILAGLLIIFVITGTLLLVQEHKSLNEKRILTNAANKIIELNLTQCRVLSSSWVPVNYYTNNVFFLGKTLPAAINNNEIVLVFPDWPTRDDTFNMSDLKKYPKLFENEQFMLIGAKTLSPLNCEKRSGWALPMIADSCKIISQRFSFMNMSEAAYSACRFLNFPKKPSFADS